MNTFDWFEMHMMAIRCQKYFDFEIQNEALGCFLFTCKECKAQYPTWARFVKKEGYGYRCPLCYERYQGCLTLCEDSCEGGLTISTKGGLSVST